MSAEVSAAHVKALRERTGAGIMDCKAALAEAEGDMEKATTVIFTMGCKNGHKQEVDEGTARDINATACLICYSPILVKGVKTVQAKRGAR